MVSHGHSKVTDPMDELTEAAAAFARAILAAVRADDEDNLSIAAAAKRLGVSRGTVYNLITRGELEDVRIAGRHLIPASEIRRLTRRSTK